MIHAAVPFQHLADRIGVVPGVHLEVWDVLDPLPPPALDVLVTRHTSSMAAQERIAGLIGVHLLQTMTIGTDWIDRHVPAGAMLARATGVVESPASEHALAILLAVLRDVPDYVREQEARRWRPRWSRSLAGSTVALLGWGGLAQAIDRKLAAFEPAKVLRFAQTSRTTADGTDVLALDRLQSELPKVDVLLVALPLLPETRGFVNATVLSALPDGAVVVNIGRGPLIDRPALEVELRRGRLRAALDVTDPEPLEDGDPFWVTPGLLITPHVGANTDTYWGGVANLVREQLRRMVEGRELLNVVPGRRPTQDRHAHAVELPTHRLEGAAAEATLRPGDELPSVSPPAPSASSARV